MDIVVQRGYTIITLALRILQRILVVFVMRFVWRLWEGNDKFYCFTKVPSDLESQTDDVTASVGTTSGEGVLTHVPKQKKLLRKPSKKLIAKGLVLVRGAICLSRGHSAQVALAYLLKLNKRGTPESDYTGK